MRKIIANSLWSNKYFLLCWVLLAGFIVSTAGEAVELYRCLRDGAVEFRQTACEDGEQSVTEVIEQSGGISPVEPALRLEKVSPQKTGSAGDPDRSTAVNERCWKTRQRLEWVERRLRAGYKPSQSEGLHRKQREYDDYLKRFCRS